MGQAGMPDAFRITVEGFGAHPQHKARARASIGRYGNGFRGAIAVLLPCDGVCAAASGRYELAGFDAYMAALAWPDRDDIAAVALTLGILCFAILSAILFLRTRRHLAAVEAAARDEALASKAALDRAYALLLSEPQILLAWPPTADEPEIIGDPGLVTAAPAGVLEFGAWLQAEPAR